MFGFIRKIRKRLFKKKDKITLTVEKTSFSPGDIIKGTVRVLTVENVMAKSLSVFFRGTFATDEKDNIYFEYRHLVRTENQFDGGKEFSQDFQITIPKNIHSLPGGSSSKKINWILLAKLDAEKKKIEAKKSISIA